jgi:hypothetical protein
MPKFVIERQYLVPMYHHIVVEAENLEEACKKGVSDDIDWDTQEMDSDGARKTTITNAKLIPEDKFSANTGAGVLFDVQSGRRDTASPRFSMRTRPGPVRSWRSRSSSPTTNNPPRLLGSS